MSRIKKHQNKVSKKAQTIQNIRTRNASVDLNELLREAIRSHQANKLDDAESLYRQILKSDPDNFDSLHMVGVLCCQRGKPYEGITLMQNAVLINPDSPAAYNNLGKALSDTGRHEEAITCYKKAIALDPKFALAYSNLSNTLNLLEKPEEAFVQCKKAISLNPNLAEAFNNLGISQNNMGKTEEVIVSYEKAITLNPQFADAYNNLGILLNATEKPKEAMACYRKAIELNPDFVNALVNLSHLFEKTNRLKESHQTITQALQKDPENPLTNLVAARCERRAGNFKGALARLDGIPPQVSDSEIAKDILFERGILSDRLGHYNQAFECFYEANKKTSQTRIAKNFKKEIYIQRIKKIKYALLNHLVESTESPSSEFTGSDPIFLIGFPRSGTTLLDQILNAHPNIETLEEKPLVQAMIERLKVYGLNYPDDWHRMDSDVLDDLQRTYFQNASEYLQHRPDIKVIDKLPLHIVDAGLIHKVFPKSKIILALRHPADVCLSCFFQNFKLNEAMIHFLDIQDTASFYDMVMDLWHEYTKMFSLNYHVVRYEDLITDFDKETKGIFQFLDISWDPSVRDYYRHAKSRRKIATPSYHQVIEPIYKRSMYRWKNYEKQLTPILDILIPHIERFGYSLKNKPSNQEIILQNEPVRTATHHSATQS